jgi:hypothetical protein
MESGVDDDVVKWDITPTDTTSGRLCVYGLVGMLGGLALLAVVAVAFAVAAAVTSADPGTLVVIVILVLVGGPMSAVALVPFLDADQRPDDLQFGGRFDLDDLHSLGIAVSAIVGAAGIAATVTSETVLGVFPFVGTLFVVTTGLGIGAPKGRVDRDAGTLTVHENTHPLADLASVRALEIGGLVVVTTRFVARPGGRDAPFLFTVPAESYAQVADAFDVGVAAESPVESTRSAGERVAVAATGVGALALAAGLAAIGATSTTDGADVLYYVASLPAMFGVLFLTLAARATT